MNRNPKSGEKGFMINAGKKNIYIVCAINVIYDRRSHHLKCVTSASTVCRTRELLGITTVCRTRE